MGMPSQDNQPYINVSQQPMLHPMQMQKVIPESNFYQQYVEQKVDWAQKVVTGIGDLVGYGTILTLIGFGALFIFKNKIKKWIKDD